MSNIFFILFLGPFGIHKFKEKSGELVFYICSHADYLELDGFMI